MAYLWQNKENIQYRKGVGPRRAEFLKRLGIETVSDLLMHFPREHEDRSSFAPLVGTPTGETTTFKAVVDHADLRRLRGRMTLLKVIVRDESGRGEFVWFNQPFLEKKMTPGTWLIVKGTVKSSGLVPSITVREYEVLGEDEEADALAGGRITPIYPLTTGISAGWMRREVRAILKTLPEILDPLPEKLLAENGLIDLDTAVRSIHYPDSWEDLDRARQRLAFDEFFRIQLTMGHLRFVREAMERGRTYSFTGDKLRRVTDQLPFTLTDGQRRSLEEIRSDLEGKSPMNRLLQGDVGSGKTAVAVLATALAVESGYQVAFMAPTEIVAEQHYRNWREILSEAGIECALLTGSTKEKERASILSAVERGECHLLFGTHALIEGNVTFKNLGLVVIDEQHRFGVLQRKALIEKTSHPDVLVLTATPIPRTLAMTVYSDLSLSTIKESPAGRQPITTKWLAGDERKKMLPILTKELAIGHRVFFVYPLVEESEVMDLKNAKSQAEKIQKAFPDYRVGLVTGRMKGEEKEAVMHGFKSGAIQILVATTVVEVGVDVPEATVMVIEHAERFGLAQLHQLRGRVGRGSDASYCVLTTANRSELTFPSRRRMETLAETTDGFVIAEEDLKLRGPGEFMGLRQHGLPELKVARLVGDEDILKQATDAARKILKKDAELAVGKNLTLKKWLDSFKHTETVGA